MASRASQVRDAHTAEQQAKWPRARKGSFHMSYRVHAHACRVCSCACACACVCVCVCVRAAIKLFGAEQQKNPYTGEYSAASLAACDAAREVYIAGMHVRAQHGHMSLCHLAPDVQQEKYT